MNQLIRLLATTAVTAALAGACGQAQSTGTAASPTSNTEATTTTTLYVAPTTTTVDVQRAAMFAWTTAHKNDLVAVRDAVAKVGSISEQISTTAGNNVDNYTATHDGDQLMAGANKVIALQNQEKTACLGVATAVKAAQKNLPIPVPEINEPYSSALDHYLSAARACQVGETSDTTSELSEAGSDIGKASAALTEYFG